MTAQTAKLVDFRAYKKQGASAQVSTNYNILAEINTLKKKLYDLEQETQVLSVQIFGTVIENYKLSHSIDVLLEICANETLAIIPNLELYGEGETEIEAVNNLKLELIDLYEQLNSTPDEKLGKELLARKRTLNELIIIG